VYPEDVRYTETHQWARAEGSVATVGISHYAQEQMGELVYVEVPEVGQRVAAGEPFASIESVKAVEDVESPVSGVVVEVNEALADEPATVNSEPYGKGWIAKIEMENAEEMDSLWTAARYQEFLKTL
jgi:glycine cleavage system H protein